MLGLSIKPIQQKKFVSIILLHLSIQVAEWLMGQELKKRASVVFRPYILF